MIRLELVAGLLAALLFAFIELHTPAAPRTYSLSSPEATTTLPGFGTTTPLLLPPVLLPSLASSTLQAVVAPHASSTKSTTKKPVITATVPPAFVLTIPAPPPVSQSALDAAASTLRAALVNIICFAPAGSPIRSISASGVIVNASGYILTDAHVAQYFLLANQGVSCTIRTGDPATNAYRARLAFISPEWLQDNSAVITEDAPSGTGEHDFALLAITASATATPLPATFPAVPLAVAPPAEAAPVVIGSYGAQFLQFSEIETSLSPTIVFGSIKKLFTFGTNTADVFSLGGSAAAQEGSSGGGVIDANGLLTGDITTSTVEGDTSTRTLSAITASYIRREYDAEAGVSLDGLFAESPAAAAADFAPQAHALEVQLLAAIQAAH